MKLSGKSLLLGMASFILTMLLSCITGIKQKDAINEAVDRRLLELANARRKEDDDDVIDAE